MRTPILRTLLALGSSLLLSAACEDDEDSRGRDASVYFEDAGPYPLYSEIGFYEARVLATDEAVNRCCERVGLTFTRADGDFLVPAPDPTAGAKFNEGAAAACVAQIREQDCDLAKGPIMPLGACGRVYDRGRREYGEPCSSFWDCASTDEADTYVDCFFVGGTVQGNICGKRRARGVGESCGVNSDPRIKDNCRFGLWCDPATSLCVMPAEIGQSCVTGTLFGDTCAHGAVCDRVSTKACVQPKAVGEACSALEECEALACVGGTCREPLFHVPLCDAP